MVSVVIDCVGPNLVLSFWGRCSAFSMLDETCVHFFVYCFIPFLFGGFCVIGGIFGACEEPWLFVNIGGKYELIKHVSRFRSEGV